MTVDNTLLVNENMEESMSVSFELDFIPFNHGANLTKAQKGTLLNVSLIMYECLRTFSLGYYCLTLTFIGAMYTVRGT